MRIAIALPDFFAYQPDYKRFRQPLPKSVQRYERFLFSLLFLQYETNDSRNDKAAKCDTQEKSCYGLSSTTVINAVAWPQSKYQLNREFDSNRHDNEDNNAIEKDI
ncbi:MAG: hypothetical protein KC708_13735 [Anaerolineae bacterium]|nr:hypothetical protein [Anaerolineae bacterium]